MVYTPPHDFDRFVQHTAYVDSCISTCIAQKIALYWDGMLLLGKYSYDKNTNVRRNPSRLYRWYHIMHMICTILMMADKPMWGLPTCSKLYFILVGQLLDDRHNFFYVWGTLLLNNIKLYWSSHWSNSSVKPISWVNCHCRCTCYICRLHHSSSRSSFSNAFNAMGFIL